MSISASKNIGAFIHAAIATVVSSQTAGAAATVTGIAIDRFAVPGAGPIPLSCSILIPVVATLASTHTMSLAYSIQDSVDSTSGDFSNMLEESGDVVAATVEVTGNIGGTAQNLLVKLDVNLAGAREWVRVVVTPSFSASSVDTAVVGNVVIVFGGQDILP